MSASKRAWEIAGWFQAERPQFPRQISTRWGVSQFTAEKINQDATTAFGPLGKGEEWFAGRIDKHLGRIKPNGMSSMTFGTVPSYSDFYRHVTTWRNDDGEGIHPHEEPVFWMELARSEMMQGKEAAQDIPGIVVDTASRTGKLRITISDVAALWAFINALVHHADDAAEDSMDEESEKYLSLASGIMGQLGYEWV